MNLTILFWHVIPINLLKSLNELDLNIAEKYVRNEVIGTQNYLKKILSSESKCIELNEI